MIVNGKKRATQVPALKAHPVPDPAMDSLNQICSVRIELLHTAPLIWREVEVPTSITLKVLHDVVQIAMGWFDQHLWEIRIAKQVYGPPTGADWGGAPRANASKVRLRDVLKPRRTTIEYLYDFGDSWEHRLIVTAVRQGNLALSYPRYVAGERAGPPEDCGGLPGFYHALDVLADPAHPDHADVADWLDDYDPDKIDELPLTIALGRIANRCKAAQTRLAKKGT